MSTRSAICVQHPAGNFTSVYCHSDGYYSWNGRRLMEHWHSYHRAAALVAMGDISTLGKAIGKKHDFNWRSKLHDQVRHETERRGFSVYSNEAKEIETQMRNALPQVVGDWTMFYRRDRDDTEAPMGVTVDTREEIVEWFGEMWCEYLYVFQHETWWTLDREIEAPVFIPLMGALKADEDTMRAGPIKPGPCPYLPNRSKRLSNTHSPPGEPTQVTQGRRPLVI